MRFSIIFSSALVASTALAGVIPQGGPDGGLALRERGLAEQKMVKKDTLDSPVRFERRQIGDLSYTINGKNVVIRLTDIRIGTDVYTAPLPLLGKATRNGVEITALTGAYVNLNDVVAILQQAAARIPLIQTLTHKPQLVRLVDAIRKVQTNQSAVTLASVLGNIVNTVTGNLAPDISGSQSQLLNILKNPAAGTATDVNGIVDTLINALNTLLNKVKQVVSQLLGGNLTNGLLGNQGSLLLVQLDAVNDLAASVLGTVASLGKTSDISKLDLTKFTNTLNGLVEQPLKVITEATSAAASSNDPTTALQGLFNGNNSSLDPVIKGLSQVIQTLITQISAIIKTLLDRDLINGSTTVQDALLGLKLDSVSVLLLTVRALGGAVGPILGLDLNVNDLSNIHIALDSVITKIPQSLLAGSGLDSLSKLLRDLAVLLGRPSSNFQ